MVRQHSSQDWKQQCRASLIIQSGLTHCVTIVTSLSSETVSANVRNSYLTFDDVLTHQHGQLAPELPRHDDRLASPRRSDPFPYATRPRGGVTHALTLFRFLSVSLSGVRC